MIPLNYLPPTGLTTIFVICIAVDSYSIPLYLKYANFYLGKIDDMVVDYNTLKGLQKDNTNWPTFKTKLENQLKDLARNLEREIKYFKNKIHRSENLMHIATEQHQRALRAQIDEDNRWVNAIIRDKNMVLEWIKNLNRLPWGYFSDILH